MTMVITRPGHTALSSLGIGLNKKSSSTKKQQQQKEPSVETGTANKNGVDFDWLPEQFKADLKSESLWGCSFGCGVA